MRRRIERQGVERRDRIPPCDRSGHHLVQCAAGVHAETRRVAFGHPAHVDTRHAIGLLFTNQNRRRLLAHQSGAPLQGVAVFVCEQPVYRHVAEELLGDGHQIDSVPGD